jgi:hypothetical protein
MNFRHQLNSHGGFMADAVSAVIRNPPKGNPWRVWARHWLS